MQNSGSGAPLSTMGLETGRRETSEPVNVEDRGGVESLPGTMDSAMAAGSEAPQTSVFLPLSAGLFPEPTQEHSPPVPALLPSETTSVEEEESLFVSTPPPLSPISPGSNPEHWSEYFSQVDTQYFSINYASAITEVETILPLAASLDLSSFHLALPQGTATSQADLVLEAFLPLSSELPSTKLPSFEILSAELPSPELPPSKLPSFEPSPSEIPSLELPSQPQQGQKHGRPSPEAETEKPAKRMKKSSGNTEQEPAMGVKTILSWFKEDEHPKATVELFKVFCDNVKHYTQKANSFAPPSKKDLKEIRKQLHTLPFHSGITNLLLNQSGILDDGLRAIYMKPDIFPADMTDFASELQWKWTNKRQSPNIYHGLALQMTSKGTKSDKNLKFNKNWKFEEDTIRPQVTSYHFGDGHLYNGQWWPKNYLAQRDGAHGNSMTGIHGSKTNGAYSIVMSKFEENSEDVDNGDEITYCGQAGKAGKIPEGTQALLESARRGNEIRVLRTAKLPKSNNYRPEYGIRYDGRYKIVSVEDLTEDEQPAKTGKGKKLKKEKKDEEDKKVTHRFVLRRVDGQSPLCPVKSPGARPTAQEIEEYETAESLHELAFQSARRQIEDSMTDEDETESDTEGDVEETEDVILQAALQESLQKQG